MIEKDVSTEVKTAQIENSEQSLSEELSLSHIAKILIQNWPLFVVLFIIISSALTFVYSYKVPYVATSSIIINDSKNSSLQSFASQFMGQEGILKVTEGKKANSSIQKDIEYLKTVDFYQKLLKNLSQGYDKANLSLNERHGFTAFNKTILKNKSLLALSEEDKLVAIQYLDGLLKINLSTDYEIEVTVKSMDRQMAYYIVNQTVPVIASELKDRQLNDLIKIKTFLNSQKDSLDKSISEINKKLSDFQSKPENLISLSSKDKVGEYLSELMVRKNEIRMKISENNKIINSLGGSGNKKDSALYGHSGKIQSLKIENDMLESKLIDLQKTIGSVSYQAKAIPQAGMIYEDLKKKSDIEFQNYKNVTESLSKLEAYQLSLNNKYEVLETAQFDKVRPAIGLLTLLIIALLVSQIIGSIVIYLKSIWHTSYVTASSTRNVVVVDSHSLDPRVFIENSKIKFKLRHAAFDQQSSIHQRKLSFGRKAINDDTHDADTSSTEEG